MSRRQALLGETFRSGTIASLVMMPFGFLFRMLELRVGHYGRELLLAVTGPLPPPVFGGLLLLQHFIIGWLSTWPLLIAMRAMSGASRSRHLLLGLAYGAGYYALLNSWLLPRAFGDALPWTLGVFTVLPSLVVHLVFGLSIGWTGFAHARRHSAQPNALG